MTSGSTRGITVAEGRLHPTSYWLETIMPDVGQRTFSIEPNCERTIYNS